MKMLLLWGLAATILLALSPVAKTPLAGSLFDLCVDSKGALAAGEGGRIYRIEWGEAQATVRVRLPQRQGVFGPVTPHVYSACEDAQGRLAAIIQGPGSLGRVVQLISPDGSVRELVDANRRATFRKLRFVDENHLLAVEVGGVAWLIAIDSGRVVYKTQVMNYVLTDFVLNHDGSRAALSGESGEVTILDTMSGKVLEVLSGGSRDNVYGLDWRSGYLITAGVDRVAAVFDESSGGVVHHRSDFLVSAAALSPSADKIAYVINESSDIGLFDRVGGNLVATLKGHFAMVGHIVFVDEKRLMSGGDDSYILHWRLP